MSSARRTIEPSDSSLGGEASTIQARETRDRVSLTASFVVRFADYLSSSVCQPSTEVLGYYRSSASPTSSAESIRITVRIYFRNSAANQTEVSSSVRPK